ncbi:MAG: histidinol-phosphate aminotransferase family protein [Clostridiales bacterium]|nr:histidinol-phosphate aminotransferase family protein [Clostridiales bacterium]
MTYQLNEKVINLAPYETEKGKYKVVLNAGESFLPVHPDMKKDILSAVRKVAFNRYPDPEAAKCCKAFADYYSVEPALVTAGNGSDELIGLILSGFFSKGEKVLVAEPDFSMYEFYADEAELELVRYQKAGDYRIEPEALVRLAKEEHCRGLIFSNPCNPTSQGLKKMPLRALLKELPEVLVVIDEAYMDFWNQSLINEAEEFDNLIILRTSSKAVGSAAIRLGFAVCHKKLTKALQALKSPYNVNAMTQAAGAAIYKHQDILKEAQREILAARGFLAGALLKLEAEWKGTLYEFHLIPEPKTNFVVLCFNKGKNNEVYGFLKKKGILVRCFPDFLRVTVGNLEENQKFLDALRTLQ